MSANDAHRLELQVAIQECYLNGDAAGAAELEAELQEFEDCMED
jgi:hypothetical protein